MEIDIHCDDGSDPRCCGTVKIELAYSGLYEVHINWIKDRAMGRVREVVSNIEITPKDSDDWARQNERLLSQSDIESIQKSGSFKIRYSDLPHAVCDPCGSDQDYNEEGENTSAL